jgi:hypothetical protein
VGFKPFLSKPFVANCMRKLTKPKVEDASGNIYEAQGEMLITVDPNTSHRVLRSQDPYGLVFR